jgi:hypothetical protein
MQLDSALSIGDSAPVSLALAQGGCTMRGSGSGPNERLFSKRSIAAT